MLGQSVAESWSCQCLDRLEGRADPPFGEGFCNVAHNAAFSVQDCDLSTGEVAPLLLPTDEVPNDLVDWLDELVIAHFIKESTRRNVSTSWANVGLIYAVGSN